MSKAGSLDWLFAIYLVTTILKGLSSIKLHRDMGITRNGTWHFAHRIRRALKSGGLVDGPVEVDGTNVGGKRRNMSNSKRKQLTGPGPVGKTDIVEAKDRETKQVAAKVVNSTDKKTLRGFYKNHAAQDATVYTDDATGIDTICDLFEVRISTNPVASSAVTTALPTGLTLARLPPVTGSTSVGDASSSLRTSSSSPLAPVALHLQLTMRLSTTRPNGNVMCLIDFTRPN